MPAEGELSSVSDAGTNTMSCCSDEYGGCMAITLYAGKTENPTGMRMTGSGHSDLQAP